MNRHDLLPEYADVLTTQEYGKTLPIQGVAFLPMKYHKDDTGEFVELGRFSGGYLEGVEGFQVAQVSYSLLLPGAIKAFHIHFRQTDVWYVSPHERLLVGLLDTREKSSSCKQTMRFVLGGGTAQLLVIPAGVAHGAANPWGKPVGMTYFTNQKFDPAAPDEHRLPFDLFGEDFWKVKKG